jgi:hypothetical protein
MWSCRDFFISTRDILYLYVIWRARRTYNKRKGCVQKKSIKRITKVLCVCIYVCVCKHDFMKTYKSGEKLITDETNVLCETTRLASAAAYMYGYNNGVIGFRWKC